jgi:hypothetical protein
VALSPKEVAAWATFMDGVYGPAGRRTEFSRNANRLAQERSPYWNRPVELVARAAEASVYELLLRRGARSDYLVGADVESEKRDRLKRPIREYPIGAERAALADALQDLIRSMEARLISPLPDSSSQE